MEMPPRAPSNPELKVHATDVTLHAVSARQQFQGQQLEWLINNHKTLAENQRILHQTLIDGIRSLEDRIDRRTGEIHDDFKKASKELSVEASKARMTTRLWSTVGTGAAFALVKAVWERLVDAWHAFFRLSIRCGSVRGMTLQQLYEDPLVRALVGTLIVIAIAKLPDPRKFEGKWWHYFYSVFFAFASRASVTEWNTYGGRLKLPGFQVPALKDVPLEPPKENS